MIDSPVTPMNHTPNKVTEAFDSDDFGYFLENDAELQKAYMACIEAAGIQWTDEELAEAAFRAKYGDTIDDLMAYWRQQQAMLNPADPEHTRAVAVDIAVKKWQRRNDIRKAVNPHNPRHTR